MKFMQWAFRNCAYFDLELPGTSVSKPLKLSLDPTFQLGRYVDFLKIRAFEFKCAQIYTRFAHQTDQTKKFTRC